jgi:hypothetical protein
VGEPATDADPKAPPPADEFREIGHAGGTVTFRPHVDQAGQRSYSVEIAGSRPVPMTMIGIWALPPGIPIESLPMGGMGSGIPHPPLPDALPVYIVGDSEGRFGHNCPCCGGYWRSGPWPNVCPYCAVMVPSHQFLSQAQLRYVRHYCAILASCLQSDSSKEAVINMNEVADAVGKEGEKPAFYVSEESQQCKFTCEACDEFNDILGRFGYCSSCGTRNDLSDFLKRVVPSIRERLKSGARPEDAVRDSVSAFESLTAQFAKQLSRLVPLTERRINRLNNQRFHNLKDAMELFRGWFDIDMGKNVKEADIRDAERLFHRRHLYEHSGGEVDQKYIDDSGDTSVRLKQHIHETQEGAHNLISTLSKLARNTQEGFHELLPPVPQPIRAYQDKKARIEQYERQHRRAPQRGG